MPRNLPLTLATEGWVEFLDLPPVLHSLHPIDIPPIQPIRTRSTSRIQKEIRRNSALPKIDSSPYLLPSTPPQNSYRINVARRREIFYSCDKYKVRGRERENLNPS